MTKKFDKKIIKPILAAIFLSMALAFISTAAICSANDTGGGWWQTAQEGGLEQVGEAYGGDEPRDVREVVVDVIRVILGFLGILAVIIILFAGFKWMTAGGNEENVATAKKILIAGVIGLIIILSAYVIANFVIDQVYGATAGEPVF